MPASLRAEAVRYHTRLIGRVRELLATRIPSFEAGEYNVPAPIYFAWFPRTWRQTEIEAIQAADLKPSLLPMVSMTGPACPLILDQPISDKVASGAITDQQLIDWCAVTVATAKSSLGSSARIMPSLWPRFYCSPGVSYPNGSPIWKSGFATRFCNALLDAGAQGFSCWTPGLDQTLTAAQQQGLMNSWAEVVAVFRARGFRKLTPPWP